MARVPVAGSRDGVVALLAGLGCFLAAATFVPAAARATAPGPNGKIAFVSGGDLLGEPGRDTES